MVENLMKMAKENLWIVQGIWIICFLAYLNPEVLVAKVVRAFTSEIASWFSTITFQYDSIPMFM